MKIRLDELYLSLSAGDLAQLVSWRLDADTSDRREFAEALAKIGTTEESARLRLLADHVEHCERNMPPTDGIPIRVSGSNPLDKGSVFAPRRRNQ